MNKLSAAYWKGRLFQPTYTHEGEVKTSDRWVMQVSHAGKQRKVTLPTVNRVEAAGIAARFYRVLLREGWDAALRWLDPDKHREADGLTVGDWIATVEEHGQLHPRTFDNYTHALRWFAKELRGVDGTRRRFDYKGGGTQEFRAVLDATPLTDFTSDAVQRVVERFLKRKASNPITQREASNSIHSQVRNARSLFNRKLTKRLSKLGVTLPATIPFQGIELPDRPSTRYVSRVNYADLLDAGRKELRDARPGEWIGLLLGLCAGLRRAEIAALTWPQVRFDTRDIFIRSTEDFAAKTEGSEDVVLLSDDVIEELRWWRSHPDAPSEFVLPGAARIPTGCRGWRSDREVFKPLLGWLRSKGVNTRKPIHTLRKEFGSYVAQHGDIHVAQSQLRHAQISTTAAYYTENRRRVAPGFGGTNASATANLKVVA